MSLRKKTHRHSFTEFNSEKKKLQNVVNEQKILIEELKKSIEKVVQENLELNRIIANHFPVQDHYELNYKTSLTYILMDRKPEERDKKLLQVLLDTGCMTIETFEMHKSYFEEHIKLGPLSLEEGFSLFLYTLEGPDVYKLVNKTLVDIQRTSTLPLWRPYIWVIINALKKLPVYHNKNNLYRVVNVNLAEVYPQKYQEGKSVKFYSFVATSASKQKAEIMLKSKNTGCTYIVIVGAVRSGRDISKFSRFDEEEILFPPTATFYVRKLWVDENNNCNMEMEEIPSLEKGLNIEEVTRV